MNEPMLPRCTRCQVVNRVGRRFCSECGAPLVVHCGQCGFSNEVGEAFCGGCGSGLVEAARRAPAHSDIVLPPVADIAERRQVTTLFADLSGYTQLTRELDEEEVHALGGRYTASVDTLVRRYGGSVQRHLGDAVMALFGAPLAHSNDAERAARTAVAIHDIMQELSREFERTLEAHIGIASGEVVADGSQMTSTGEYKVTGNAVNLASRLYELAGPGETLISDSTYREIAHLTDCEALEDVTLKGLDRPVQVWRMRSVGQPRLEASSRPFVGRRAELEIVSSAIRACRVTGSGQTIYVRGEAGIGKSRLLEECHALSTREGFVCHAGLVLDFGAGTGQDAIGVVVRSLIGVAGTSDQKAVAAAVDRVFEDGTLPAELRVHLNNVLSLRQPPELHAMYDAMDNATRTREKHRTITELVGRLSWRRPLIVVVEDIHWADANTLGHLESLAEGVLECPALLVMTSRAEGDPIRRAWRGGSLITLDLGPLREQDAMELAGAYLDATNRFAKRCVERAEGNPLFLDQLLRSVEESAEQSVPGSVQSIVLSRMDTLAGEDRQGLQAAAVIGQRFSLALLRHLIDDAEYDCGKLVEYFLVRPDGEDFLFLHALIQEGVYNSLLRSKRRELHRRAAAWAAERDPVLRAEHLDRADDEGAAHAYGQAARHVAGTYRHQQALDMLERGLELCKERGVRFDLAFLKGEISRDLGAIENAINAFQTALRNAIDESAECRARIGLAAALGVVDRYDEALDELERARSTALERGLTGELAQIHRYRGNIYFPLGNLEGCLEEHERARRYAREASSPESEAHALSGLGDANYQRGRMRTARGHFHGCLELAEAHEFGRIAVANRHMLGLTRFYLNDLPGALEDCLHGADGAAKVGQRRAEMAARSSVGPILHDLDDCDGVIEQSEQGLELTRRLGARRFEPLCLLNIARVKAARGDRTESRRLLRDALELSRETGITFAGPWVLGALATVTDDPAERKNVLAEGENLLRERCLAHNYLWFYRDAMAASSYSKRWDEVERYAAALEEYTRPEPLPWATFFIARARTLAAWGRGRRDEKTQRQLQRLREQADEENLKYARRELDELLAIL